MWPIKKPPDMTIPVMLHNTDPRCIPSQRIQWLIDHGYAQVDKATGLVHIIDRLPNSKGFRQMILYHHQPPASYTDAPTPTSGKDCYGIVSSREIPYDGDNPEGVLERMRGPAMVRRYLESYLLAEKGGVQWHTRRSCASLTPTPQSACHRRR